MMRLMRGRRGDEEEERGQGRRGRRTTGREARGGERVRY